MSALLSACANLTVLVTSRELLRVQGEVEYAVPPLASPDAVALFCERSRLEPSEEIAELCVRLDELPLALELAAARAKALSPRQILERLSQRLDLLEGGRDADPRQQTLRATIDWSYDLLSEEEQRALRAALASSPAAAPWTPPRRSAAPTSTRCSRWSRRACSASRPSATGCSRRSASMRANGWTRPARPMRSPAVTPTTTSRCSRSDHALSSSAPAVESCWRGSGKRRTTSGQPSTISRALRRPTQRVRRICSSSFWLPRGRLVEAQERLLRLLARTDFAAGTRAVLLEHLSDTELRMGQLDSAESHAQEAVTLAQESGERRTLAFALWDLALIASRRGDFDEAIRVLTRVLEEAADDEWLRSAALGDLATFQMEAGRDEEARHLFQEASRGFQATGDEANEAVASLNLA